MREPPTDTTSARVTASSKLEGATHNFIYFVKLYSGRRAGGSSQETYKRKSKPSRPSEPVVLLLFVVSQTGLANCKRCAEPQHCVSRNTATQDFVSISPYGVTRISQYQRHVEEHAQIGHHQHPRVFPCLDRQTVRHGPLRHERHL